MSEVTLREHLRKAGKSSFRKRTAEENMKRVTAMNEARKRKQEEIASQN